MLTWLKIRLVTKYFTVRRENWRKPWSESSVWKNPANQDKALNQVQSVQTGPHQVVAWPISAPRPRRRSMDDDEPSSWCCVWGSSGTCLHEEENHWAKAAKKTLFSCWSTEKTNGNMQNIQLWNCHRNNTQRETSAEIPLNVRGFKVYLKLIDTN